VSCLITRKIAEGNLKKFGDSVTFLKVAKIELSRPSPARRKGMSRGCSFALGTVLIPCDNFSLGMFWASFVVQASANFLSLSELEVLLRVSKHFNRSVSMCPEIWRRLLNDGNAFPELRLIQLDGCEIHTDVSSLACKELNLVRLLCGWLKVWCRFEGSLENSAPSHAYSCGVLDSMGKEMQVSDDMFDEVEGRKCIRIRPYMHLKFPPLKNLESGFGLFCSVYFRETDVGSVDFPNYLFCNWRYGQRKFLTSITQQANKLEVIVRVQPENQEPFEIRSNANSSKLVEIPHSQWVDIAFTYSVQSQEVRVYLNQQCVSQVEFPRDISGPLWKLDQGLEFGRKMDSGNGFSGCVKDIIVIDNPCDFLH
jgi:hypothetical protein